jgi:hypothetical protein
VFDNWGIEVGPTRDELLLLASELATNATLHVGTGFRVNVQTTEERTRIEVCDNDPALPAPRPAIADAESGRGLRLVEHLAAAWGAETTPDGKVVWFEMPVGSRRW